MLIEIKLNKDFERFFNVLKEEYGDDFAELNGLSESKLSYNDFMDNFVAKKTVSDSSIDGSSNVHNKDIVTLRSEMSKPHEKLMAYSKIFYEYKKEFGLREAKKWMELEWNKALYLHDANTSTFIPYSYKGTETVLVKYNDKTLYTSFQQLFDIVKEPAVCLSEKDGAYAKYPDNLYIWDFVNGQSVFTKVIRVIRKDKNDQFRFIKTTNGITQIVTNHHPMILADGSEVPCKDVKIDSELTSIPPDIKFGDIKVLYCAKELIDNNKQMILRGKEVNEESDLMQDGLLYYKNKLTPIKNILPLTKELGYLVGMILAEDHCKKNTVYISQHPGAVYDRIVDCCEACNLIYGKSGSGIKITSPLFYDLCLKKFFSNDYSYNKKLSPDIINYNKDFVLGIIGGLTDGDGSVWQNDAGKVRISLTTRTLLNQVSFYLRALGYQVREQRANAYDPSANFGREPSGKKRYGYAIQFRIYEDSESIYSVKIENAKKCGNIYSDRFANKRYSYGFEDCRVSDNYELEFDEDKFAYDISTETQHFICNNILSHNCFAYDISKLVEEGLFYLDRHRKPEPPKHLETFVDFVKEFINFTSNRTSGACGLPNLIPYMYYFWLKDIKSGHYPRCQNEETFAKSHIQRLIYAFNQPYTRDGIQSAFVNTSIFDGEYFDALFGGSVFPNDEPMMEHKEGILKFEKWFLEEMAAIKDRGRMFTFPVNTISLLKQDGEFVDKEFAEWASNHNKRWNDSNIFADNSVTSLSNCCRLKSDIAELGYFNSIGGSALKVGSVKVSTINLARIAYEAKGKESRYLSILKDRLIVDMKLLHIVRKIIKRNVEKGLLPNFQEGVIDFEHLYNTVGINGIYETMKFFNYTYVDEFGNTMYKDEAMEFGKKIFEVIHATIAEFVADKDYKVNCEQVPAETAAVKFIEADKLLYPDQTVLVTHTKTAYRFVVDDTTYLVPKNTQLKLANDNNVVTIEDFLYDTENTYEIDDTCLKEFVVIEPCENK